MNPKDIINMDYEVGDIIRIKRKLTSKDASGVGLNENMIAHEGKLTTIMRVDTISDGKTIYHVSCDRGNYSWLETMFE